MAGLLVGLVAGFLGGLAGLGGGVIMIPLMTEVLKFRQHEAHGTSLLAVLFTAVPGACIYYFHGSVDITASALIAALALCTVRLGARYCSGLAEWKLKRYFGFFLQCIALLLVLKPLLPELVDSGSMEWMRWLVLIILGAITGFISGMMGIGGGVFMVPMMVLFAGINQITAQGISLLAMIPSSALGAWTHWKLGNTRMDLMPGLITGALVAVYAGGRVAHFIPETALRIVFAALLSFTAYRYLRVKPVAVPTCTLGGASE